MSAQHTPWPWTVKDTASQFIWGKDGACIAQLYSHDRFDGPAIPRDANARLIAAAPELLDAWQRFIAHRSRVFEAQMLGKLDEIPTDAVDKIIAAGLAAIAKATGAA